jgi:hypothetical protein
MSSEISTTRSVRSNNSSSSASGTLQSLLQPNYHSPAQLSIKYSSNLEHASHHKDKGVRRSATSSSLERLTPRQFLDKYSLPRVVRVVTPSDDGGDTEGDVEQRRMLLGPLAEPLLLYRQYKSTKVQARSLQSAKLWKTVGPSLVIPDSYHGECFCRRRTGCVTLLKDSKNSRYPDTRVRRFSYPSVEVTDTNDGGWVLDAPAHLLSRAVVSQSASRQLVYKVFSYFYRKQTPSPFFCAPPAIVRDGHCNL